MRVLRILCVGLVGLLSCGFLELQYNVAPQLRPVKVITPGDYLMGGIYETTKEDGSKVPLMANFRWSERASLIEVTAIKDGQSFPGFGLRTYKMDGLPPDVYLLQIIPARMDDLPVRYGYGFLRVRKGGVDGMVDNLSESKLPPELKAMLSEKGRGMKDPQRDFLAYMRGLWALDKAPEKRMWVVPADLQPEKKE